MPTTVAQVITGKQITFKMGTTDYSCQVEELEIEQKADSDTVETLGCRAVISKGLEITVSGTALYDGMQNTAPAGGFYAAAQTALTAGTPIAVDIEGPHGDKWASTAAVLTDLKVSIKADDVVEFDFEFAAADLVYTPATLASA